MSFPNLEHTTPAGKAGTALTMGQLKNWVGDSTKERTIQEGYNSDTLLLDMTHNYLKSQFLEIPFSKSWGLSETKNKVYQSFGTSPDWQVITIGGIKITEAGGTLAAQGVQNRMVLHCEDTNPHSDAKGGGFEDVSLVEKFELTDEQYDKMENTYRAFKKKMLAEDPTWVPKHVADARARRLAERGAPVPPETEEEVASRMQPGMRCEAIGGRRGVIRWIGMVPEINRKRASELAKNPYPDPTESKMDHVYVGVEFDEPEGSHDGVIQGKRYFQTEPKCGAFIPSVKLKAGKEFVEVDPFASDDDDEDMDEEL